MQSNIVARIGPVTIRQIDPKDFREKIRKLSLSEVLIDFLNVNSSSEEKVDDYCQKNGYLPKDISKGFLSNFAGEQNELKEYAEKYITKSLDNGDIEYIISKVENVIFRYRLVDEVKLSQLNRDLYQMDYENYHETIEPTGRKKYIILQKEYSSHSIDVMWDHLLMAIKALRPLKQCKDIFRCRRFFFPDKHTPKQMFCSPECEDRFSRRERYRNKKSAKE